MYREPVVGNVGAQRRPREHSGIGVEGDEIPRTQSQIREQQQGRADPEGGQRPRVDGEPAGECPRTVTPT